MRLVTLFLLTGKGVGLVIDLVEKTPAADYLPISIGSLRFSEVKVENIFSIQPYNSKVEDVSKTLKKQYGLTFPGIGKSVIHGTSDVFWAGLDLYFLIASEIPILNAGVTDQSDAWVVTALTGEGANEVLDRLCPVDNRLMEEGDVVRSSIGHMPAIIRRIEDGFSVLVFRSFSKTLVHEVGICMKSVTAQNS